MSKESKIKLKAVLEAFIYVGVVIAFIALIIMDAGSGVRI